MFLINSRHPLFNHTTSLFSPEVTKEFCRVPLILFTLMPVLTQLVDLCWYLYDYLKLVLSIILYTLMCKDLHHLYNKIRLIFTASFLKLFKNLAIESPLVRLSSLENHVNIRHTPFSGIIITHISIINTYIFNTSLDVSLTI